MFESVTSNPVAVTLVLPVTTRAPVFVTAPPAVTERLPLTVLAARARPPASFNVTLLPLVMPTEEKLLALFSVISFAAPAANVAAPVTSSTPESVIAPPATTLSVPLTVLAPRSIASLSVRTTFCPLVTTTVEKALPALLSVMSLVGPASNVAVPVTDRAPDCEIGPLAVTFSAPVMELAPKAMLLVSKRVTFFAWVMATVPKLLKVLVKSTSFDPASNVAVPLTKMPPASVMSPPAVTERSKPTYGTTRAIAVLSTTVALPPLLVVSQTEPLKSLLALVSRMSPVGPGRVAVASNFAVPVTDRAPDCEIAPVATLTSSVPAVEIAPSRIPLLLTSVTAKLPVFWAETAPLKLLSASLIVTTPAPPSKLDVPPTVSGPDCVMPRASMTRLPVRLKASRTSG